MPRHIAKLTIKIVTKLTAKLVASLLTFVMAILFGTIDCVAIQNGQPLPTPSTGLLPVVRLSSGDVGNRVPSCSGVILSPKVILTAAHCSEPFRNIRKLKIEHLESNFYYKSSFKVFVAPGYQIGFHDNPEANKIGFDLAVVVLTGSISLNVQPLTLSTELADWSHDVSQIWLIANGSQKPYYDSSSASILIDNIEMIQPTGYPVFFRYRSLASGSGVCEGDSGGGVFFWNVNHWELIGIQSSKTESNKCGDPVDRGFFVPLAPYKTWIQSIIDTVS